MQMDRRQLTAADILPSPIDDETMISNAVEFVKDFLLNNFKCLSAIRSKKDSRLPHCQKSVVVPLEILDIDESSTDNNVGIIENSVRTSESLTTSHRYVR